MKKLLLLFVLSSIGVALHSQEWIQQLPQEKVKSGEVTLFEIQDAFNSYNVKNNIVDGKKIVGNEKTKVPGWKQFKRWEWYWEQRVNPVTGAFPATSATDQYLSFVKEHPAAKASLGSWVSMGPNLTDGGYAGIGRVNCVAFHPTDNNTLWVGTPSGGLWKTTDGGSTWTVLTDANAVLGVSDIAIPSDYETSHTIYIATGDRDGGSLWSLGSGARSDNCSVGVLKSTDGGATWSSTGLTYAVSSNKLIGRLLISPIDNNVLFAATSDGIKKSTNGGTSWSTVYSFSQQYYVDMIMDMEFNSGTSTIMYASTKDYGRGCQILKSSDSGDSWSAIKTYGDTIYRVELAVTPADPNYIYTIASKRNGGLYAISKSTNGGTNFTEMVYGDDPNRSYLYYFSDGSGENSGQGGYDLSIAVSPTDKNLVLIGGVNSWKSADGGTTWNICNMWTSSASWNKSGAPVVHADKHAHIFRTDGTLFEGNDGGIYRSYDNGTTWTDLSSGLRISQMYRLGVSQTDEHLTITGLQDNGSKLLSGSSWYDVTGGDGMECIIDYTNKNTQYATYVNGEIYRTANNWTNRTTISDNIGGGNYYGAWVTPYIIDPNDNNSLYVGYADVWKTTDQGNSFTKISTINSSDLLRSMAIAPSNSNFLYVADRYHIWRTNNGGTSWTDITGTLPVSTNNITYIAVKNTDENTLWVTMGGYDTKRVYQSTDGGSTWISISNGLPSLPVMCIIQNKQNSSVDELYIGTDVGVYMKFGTNDWTFFSEGLPNVVVTELDIYYDTNVPQNSKLRAATFGRGLWESDLYAPVTVAPIAAFTVSDTSIIKGDMVTFTDLSEEYPSSWEWAFEGGTPATSTEKNPIVTYNSVGIFDVSLTVTNSFGSDVKVKTDFMMVSPTIKPIAGFTADKTKEYTGTAINFTDTSDFKPTSWEWVFEGGIPATSTNQNESVTYDVAGVYDVSLKVSNEGGVDSVLKTEYITIEAMPDIFPPTNLQASVADDYVDLTWEKPVLDTVRPQIDTVLYEGFEGAWIPTGWSVKYSSTIDGTLADPSPNETTWFHCDENSFANGPNPQYIHSGIYSAGIGYDAPEFNWLISPFFDVDESTILNYWLWYYSSVNDGWITNFHVMVNDGNTWTEIKNYGTGSPNNVYDSREDISLLAFAGKTVQIAFVYEYNDGFQLMIDDVLIESAKSGYNIYRNDAVIATIDSPDILQYTDQGLEEGSYTYYLTAYYNETSNESVPSNSQTVEVIWPTPVARFSADPTSGVEPLVVQFTDSSDFAKSWSWNFGNDNSSTEQHPQVTFSSGTYTITLEVTNSSGVHSITKENLIVVNANAIPEDLANKLQVYPNPTSDFMQVSFENNNGQTVQMSLFDLQGKRVKKLESDNSLLIEKQLDLRNLDNGNYLLKIVVGNENIVISILKN